MCFQSVMIKNTAISLFLSVILVSHPVLPFIEYYTFKEYIVNNLCINRNNPKSCCEGKCYLEKRIKENNSDNSTEKQNSVVPQLKRIEYRLPEKCNFSFNILEITTDSEFIVPNYTFNFYHSIFHPPKV